VATLGFNSNPGPFGRGSCRLEECSEEDAGPHASLNARVDAGHQQDPRRRLDEFPKIPLKTNATPIPKRRIGTNHNAPTVPTRAV